MEFGRCGLAMQLMAVQSFGEHQGSDWSMKNPLSSINMDFGIMLLRYVC